MPASEKHTISRTLWRFLEISLFFAVSVLGYNFLAKTSSCNTKSKSKETFSRVVAVQYYSGEGASVLFADRNSPLPNNNSYVHSSPPSFAPSQQNVDSTISYLRTVPPLTQNAPIAVKTALFLHHQAFIM